MHPHTRDPAESLGSTAKSCMSKAEELDFMSTMSPAVGLEPTTMFHASVYHGSVLEGPKVSSGDSNVCASEMKVRLQPSSV